MGNVTVHFGGYPDDLVAKLGMDLNGFVRELAGGKTPVHRFLKEEFAETTKVREMIVRRVAVTLMTHAEERRSLPVIEADIEKKYGERIDNWIDEHRAVFAEIQILK